MGDYGKGFLVDDVRVERDAAIARADAAEKDNAELEAALTLQREAIFAYADSENAVTTRMSGETSAFGGGT